MLISSGALYVMALTSVRCLGAITPIGGLCSLAGLGMADHRADSRRRRRFRRALSQRS
ncbi:MAG: hypothetical protein DMF32_00430 [Verrucomicrobia bacterium]|nr:MAG: hypothetical protein DMF32_00430 [Verrucomicrobiota bacterium]